MRNRLLPIIFAVLAIIPAMASGKEKLVMGWPKEKPVINVTFDTFRLTANYQKNFQYSVTVEIENLTDTMFPSTTIPLVFFDKEGVRIGQSSIYIYPELGAHEKARQEVNVTTSGSISKLEFGSPKDVGISGNHQVVAHMVSMTFRSTPTGANIDIDGKNYGQTPKVLRIPAGSHTLTLTKPAFENGVYPFDVSNDEGSGGTVEVDLPMSQDILEMRDGSWVGGDVVKIDWESVVLNKDGKDTTYKRNDVKRIHLVPRMSPTPKK